MKVFKLLKDGKDSNWFDDVDDAAKFFGILKDAFDVHYPFFHFFAFGYSTNILYRMHRLDVFPSKRVVDSLDVYSMPIEVAYTMLKLVKFDVSILGLDESWEDADPIQ